MSDYDHGAIEAKWRKYWLENKTFKTDATADKPKFYCLDMFPYPSGAGLHVGHPEGYTATDILCRYKRMKGFNVLHPMGWDAFGLPAEQYAVETGTHPAITTKKNVDRFRQQIQALGFSYDWDREVNTTDPKYYKWTQWIFEQLYKKGLAYVAEVPVNWCPALGTVLANEEVIDGRSERGNHPVIRRPMRQWMLRITAYAEKLLAGLDTLDWPEGIKEMQRNWIGKSEGALVVFQVAKDGASGGPAPLPKDDVISVYTTRCDTLFGATYMVLSPEHRLVEKWLTDGTIRNPDAVRAYQKKAASKSDLERTELNKEKTGVRLAGVKGVNPVNGAAIPIYISDYVLASYGTGAIMAVPAHDERDFDFAKVFDLPIYQVVAKADAEKADATEHVPPVAARVPYTGETAFTDIATGVMVNSGFLNGLSVDDARKAMIAWLVERGVGEAKTQYKLRDWLFSRQRYWGEPFPVYYKDGMPQMLPEECLPLELPEIETYKPTETGEPPLGRAKMWAWDVEKRQVVDKALVDNKTVFPLELNTMPGFAGSSAYYLRYMDPNDDTALVSKAADEYWQNVDLYVGGCEHATGHLIYSRFWNKVLFDLGVSCKEEPFQKLVNQGMIQGRSNFVFRINNDDHSKAPVFVSLGLKDQYDTTPIHVDVNIVSADVLDIEAFKKWRPEYENAEFILEDGKYICDAAVEKMSKSMFNVVNPDMIVERYGADTLRLYEMFLGPVEQSKPWDTNGIDGCHRFLKKFWGLYYDNRSDNMLVNSDEPSKDSMKSLHKLIKKVTDDIEKFSYNTSISAFMIAVSELQQQKCHSKAVLEPLAVLIAPFAPHVAEELWHAMGHDTTVCDAQWPEFNPAFLVESEMQLTVSFNGKARFQKKFPADAKNDDIQAAVLADEQSQKYLDGKQVIKVIVVPKKIVNVVVK